MNMQNRARQILEHAITAPDGAVVVAARKLSQMSPGAQWYVQVDQLRQHMLNKGMVLDEPLFTTPLLPKGPISKSRGLGSSVGAGATTWDRWIQPLASIFGYFAMAGVAGYLAYYAYQKTIGKESDRPQRRPTRRRRPTRMRIAGRRA